MKAYISQLISDSIKQIAPNEADQILASAVFDVSAPKSEHGDYATNAAMVLFKKFAVNPAESPAKFAELLAEKIKLLDRKETFASVVNVGGFINFTLSTSQLLENLQNILDQAETFGMSQEGSGKKVIVEYFQNNIAKPPHVGHLRSAVIGDSLVRVLKFAGYDTTTDTHIGDWGVQFGILLYAYKQFISSGGIKESFEDDPINKLNQLYVEMSNKIEANPELRDLGKQEFSKLEQGDKENRDLWQWFVDVSMQDFERYRKLLAISNFDENLGESFYEDKMPQVLAEFEEKGLVKVGETGEKYVDLEDQGLGRCILVKSDGATTYHMRDFATYIYRRNEFNFYRNLYIVDVRQSHHFRQLFRVLEMAGYPAETDSSHLDFGFMSLPEGAISTRKGTVISLENMIGEANKRALFIIEEKNPGLANKEVVAQKVALAAIKYFDLSHNRQTEIIFEWDKALSFEGNTGPYLQYTHARINGIWRKSVEENIDLKQKLDVSTAMNEHDTILARKLHQFPDVIGIVAQNYFPNFLCNYLFELSQIYNTFYEANPVLKAESQELKLLRMQLSRATAQVLRNGLNLLGIEAPEEM